MLIKIIIHINRLKSQMKIEYLEIIIHQIKEIFKKLLFKNKI